jgi:hypothetical protein
MGSGETVGYSILGVALGVPIAIGLFFLLKDSLKPSTSEVNYEIDPSTGTFHRIRGGERGRSKHQKLSKKRKTTKRRK